MDHPYRPPRDNADEGLGTRFLNVLNRVIDTAYSAFSPQYALAGGIRSSESGNYQSPLETNVFMQKDSKGRSHCGHLHQASRMITIHIPNGANIQVPREPKDLERGETLVGWMVRKFGRQGVNHKTASEAIRKAQFKT
jgi:hypothetical protein